MTNFEVGQTVYYAKFEWLERGLKVEIKSGVIWSVITPLLKLEPVGAEQETLYCSDCFLTQEEAQIDAKNDLILAEKHFREKAKAVKVMAKMKWTNGEIKYEL